MFTIQSEFRYEIVRKIFEGGMGVVYEAEQHGARDFLKRVAIKVIRQSYANQKIATTAGPEPREWPRSGYR